MRIQSAEFITSATELEACPSDELPEFAFIGRSNVGKSSLINLLAQKRELAVTSSTPGRTRLLNFFLFNRQWRLVDLPGYGYAKAAKSQREKFNQMVSDFLLQRQELLCTFVLIDSRLAPQLIDLEFTHWLVMQQLPFVLVFTKTDKLKPTRCEANQDAFLQAMSEWCEVLPRFFAASTKSKQNGRKEILNFIDQALKLRQR